MAIASGDVHKAINTVWDASALNATFQALWDSSVTPAEFPVLHDQEGGPDQPWPYCVYEVSSSSTTDRMSWSGSVIREVRNVLFNFHVYARQVSGDSRTAKEIANYLAEEVMKIYGGHPTVAATSLASSLDNTGFLISQYQNDFGIRQGDTEYRWDVQYIFKVDVAIAI